ncbi:MAG: c-type cytochrome [Gammaproteobacteria bacterium]|nr:c-type cytochrome [Gammaproteobacteria bacterium]
MLQKKIIESCLLLVLSMASGAAIAATPGASMLANTCAGCHGTNGVSSGPAAPTIAGFSNDYFIGVMQQFKNAEIPSTIMTRIAKGYTDEEIKLMAKHFSEMEFKRKPQQFDAKKAAFGKRLHNKYCEKCHENGGRKSEDDAGILAGQWAPYLNNAMNDYTSGDREMHKKMKKKVDALQKDHGDAGLDALINFYASQK